MPKKSTVSEAGISDSWKQKLQLGNEPVIVGDEQWANTYNDEDASGEGQFKGPDPEQWNKERVSEEKEIDQAVEDGTVEPVFWPAPSVDATQVKGPDPAEHPERPWAGEVGVVDPDRPRTPKED